MKIPFLFLSSILFIASCKKQEVIETNEEEAAPIICPTGYDTIITSVNGEAAISSEYLAAFPDSWWQYSNDVEVSCYLKEMVTKKTISKSNETCEVHIEKTNWSGAALSSAAFIRSGIVNGDKLVYRHFDGKVGIDRQVNTEDNNVDVAWIEESSSSKGTDGSGHLWSATWVRKILALHDLYELPNGDVYENVVEIQRSYIVDDHIGGFRYDYRLFYAYGVGLIREIKPENEIEAEPATDVYLTDYYIAPH